MAYKAFDNRLARPGFAKFMRRTITPEGHTAVARFQDIVIQDVFPGRFTTVEPAAIEIHATYSGFSDEVCSVEIAPDKEAE